MFFFCIDFHVMILNYQGDVEDTFLLYKIGDACS